MRVFQDFSPQVPIAFHKPYGVLSQFTPDGVPIVRSLSLDFRRMCPPTERLDADFERLLLLTNEPLLLLVRFRC